MASILMAFEVMTPVVLMIIIGIILRKVGLMPPPLPKQMNTLCFKFFLPVMLFYDVHETNFKQSFQLPLMIFGAVTMICLFIVLCIVIPKFIASPAQQSVVIQGIYRSNYVILGIPIVSNIYQGEDIGTITMMVALIIPLFNFMAVFLFERFNGEGNVNWQTITIRILQNPLIIGAAIGIGFSLSGLHLPYVLDKTISQIAALTMPFALMVLGADLDFHMEKSDSILLFLTVTGRLFIVPLMFLPLAIGFGFRGQALASLMAMYASPAAISGYVMAMNANADFKLAGQNIVLTSVLSCVTLFCWIAVLRQLGLI